MNNKEFMNQKVCEMTWEELLNAALIKGNEEEKKIHRIVGKHKDLQLLKGIDVDGDMVTTVNGYKKDGIYYITSINREKEPKQEFPIVFKGTAFDFKVLSDGEIVITGKDREFEESITGSLPELYKAVEKSKEIRGVK